MDVVSKPYKAPSCLLTTSSFNNSCSILAKVYIQSVGPANCILRAGTVYNAEGNVQAIHVLGFGAHMILLKDILSGTHCTIFARV